ncbi:MAG: ABC transporter permease [Candidatus Gastranaerophilales bacterium]|nr:ABC transporter permease [Candidatus Gastranaerophilales bacterium]
MQNTKLKNIIQDSLLFKGISHNFRNLSDFLECVGHIGITFKEVLFLFFSGKIKFKRIIIEANRIGVDSLPLTMMISWLAGMIIALQLAIEMVKQGGGEFVGAFVTLVMLKELGPIMAAFAVVFMEGSSMAAEIASMKISNQVDAMKTLQVNPLAYLIAPKVAGAILIMPFITVIANTVGILGGLFTSVTNTELAVPAYLESIRLGLSIKDIVASLTKGAVFGCLIAIICSSIGYQTKGGAIDVGKSTTKAVVWSIVAAAIFDYIISAIFID